jgi:hypothetical protein
MTERFFRAWFRDDFPGMYVTVTQMAPGNKRQITRHRHAAPADVMSIAHETGIDELVYEHDMRWNLYMSVGLMKDKPAGKRKGGKKDIVQVPGVWVDLDTDKAGFFRDQEHCLSLLRNLGEELWPTIVVATGTGGVHAYWRCREPLGPDEAESLTTMLWCYLSSLTDAKIDKLVNADRLMKLPGSVRWPKHSHEPATLVRLLYADEVRTVPAEVIRSACQVTFDAYCDDIRARRERVRTGRLEASRQVATDGRWGTLMSLATLEDDFNIRYSWDDILIPLGWTKLDPDGDGRDIWARPGLSEDELHKSAATDYGDSHVMSLFSDSEETGLSHLLETGVTLTKYRVYVECAWKGDEAGFVQAYLEHG